LAGEGPLLDALATELAPLWWSPRRFPGEKGMASGRKRGSVPRELDLESERSVWIHRAVQGPRPPHLLLVLVVEDMSAKGAEDVWGGFGWLVSTFNPR